MTAASAARPPAGSSAPTYAQIGQNAVNAGLLTGVAGVFTGGIAGIIRSSHPALFAASSGVQCFVLGSSYFASRGFLIDARDPYRKLSPREKFWASGAAGSIAGTVGGALRGRANILPGAVVFGAIGLLGQTALNLSAGSEAQPESKTSWMNSKWSPVRALSDAEYEGMIQERLLEVQAQIALVDEQIHVLKEEQKNAARPNQ